VSARHLLPLVLVLAACGDGGRRVDAAADAAPSAADTPAQAGPADTLVAKGALADLWLTHAREARDSAGGACVERALEIRREGRRIPVPLLYTAEAPRFVDDSTAEVHLWGDCRPTKLYRVNLTTGQPQPVSED
jgi:hypothetical protein